MPAKTCIVTGASRGIGRETSKSLAEAGHHVITVARSENPLHELQDQYPQRISAFTADLTEQEDLKSLVKHIRSKFEGVQVLINNAGGLINKPFKDLTDKDWHAMLDANLMTAVQITRSLLPYFADDAHIVNISSMGGYQGSAKFPGLTAYSVAKGGLSILTECLAAELSDRNICCNALCLGMVQTDMLEEAFPGVEAPVTGQEMGDYIRHFALEGRKFYNGKILPVALQDPE